MMIDGKSSLAKEKIDLKNYHKKVLSDTGKQTVFNKLVVLKLDNLNNIRRVPV